MQNFIRSGEKSIRKYEEVKQQLTPERSQRDKRDTGRYQASTDHNNDMARLERLGYTDRHKR